MQKTLLLLTVLLQVSTAAQTQPGQWQLLKTQNHIDERNECGLAALNGRLYLIGGDAAGSLPVEAFDPVALRWTERAAPPVALHHFQAVVHKNKVYVLEAFYQGRFPNQDPAPAVYIYDPKKNRWKTGGAIPADRRRAGAGAVAYGGKLYLVAGIQHGHSSGTTGMFDCYNPGSGKWTTLPDAPHIRDHCSAAVVQDKLYVVGGRNTSYHEPDNFMAFFSHTVLEVDCYDFKTGTWSTLPALLPLGSGGGAVVNLGNNLYYMGGERATPDSPNAPRKNTYFLDRLSPNQWTETDSLQFGRNGMAAVVWNNKIYAIGGSGRGPGGPPPGIGAGHQNSPPPIPPKDKNDGPGSKISIEVFTPSGH